MRSIFGIATLLLVALSPLFAPVAVPGCRAAEANPEAAAAVDSSTVAAFLALPAPTIEERRARAAELLQLAEEDTRGTARRDVLREAAAIDPAGTANWLALSDLEFLMGYELSAEESLAAARLTIDFLTGEQRKEAVRDYSLAMAWREYRMARWKQGLEWGERALKYDAGMPGHLIVGLNNGQLLTSWKEVEKASRVFLPRNTGNRQANTDWVYTMYQHFHIKTYNPSGAGRYIKRSTKHYEHDTLRWRDFGLFCEGHDDGNRARAYYEKSARVLPVAAGGWLTRLERSLPVLHEDLGPMPFWINPDGGYVTGSLLAYLVYARDRMVSSDNETEKDIWAEQVLAYCGRTQQRYLFYPWPALWRSEALLELDKVEEALGEVVYARDKFLMEEIEEPALNRVHGHILLVQKRYGHAAPMLRQAVADFPQDATCWADLGIAEAVVGGRDTAEAAFNRALVLDNELAAAWYNRGLLKWKHGDRQSGLADLEKAAALVPENPEIRADLARFLQANRK